MRLLGSITPLLGSNLTSYETQLYFGGHGARYQNRIQKLNECYDSGAPNRILALRFKMR